ncbi:MAG: protein kinase [Candidatus Acidiferrales bacterium]
MLSPGTRLGSYEIVGPLGAGGMGEVYRAHDTRLRRSVAIKILPVEFSADEERLRRFQREAHSASSLNHPNIITIYEMGQEGSTHFIAMELIQGRTLREILNAGRVPIRRAIEIATQIAEGLAKAHEAGVAHRDLKPDNLMITEDGFVKILDFGLAKQALGANDSPETQEISGSDTRPGEVFGTLQYMSPEQARGDVLDFRSDQFSFGVVAYEMVTGRQAFRKNTVAATLLAVLQEQLPPLGTVNPDAPAPLCWAIERCLAKESEARYVSTRDLARELATIRDRLSEKPSTVVDRQPSNIPTQRTQFVGHEKEVAAAAEVLTRPDVRLVTVTGPGGIGKTRLAVEVARGLAEQFPGGIHFVPLSPITNPELISSAIVQALKIREGGGQAPLDLLKKTFQDSLTDSMLLVLDNFEHLMQAAPTVAELLAMGPNLKILVTSRAALEVYGEHEFPVPPLGVPDLRSTPSLDALSKFPAVTLFVQRARAAKPDFVLDQQNASAVAEICARLDGLPLAIELAAARVKVLSPAAMRTRLASRLQLLTGGARDLPQRQQTLRDAIDWSYDLLTPAEQRLFRRLSVFAGGCTLESVEAVCDAKQDLDLDLLDGMASLVNKSLVQQQEQGSDDTRFVMLETIREYAREKLQASAEADVTRRAHAAYCLVLAEEDVAEQNAGDGPGWLERFAAEHDNFRAALEWLIETGNAEWGLRLGAGLFRFWESRDYLAEGRDWLGKLLALPGAAAPTKPRLRALFAAGVLATEQGDYRAADTQLGESLGVAHQLHDKQGVAVALNALAVVARDQGSLPVADSLFEESLVLWRELGDQRAVARGLSNLASIAKLTGDYPRVRSLHAECLAIFRELGDRTGVAWSLNYQGDAARFQGDFELAEDLCQQALEIFQDAGDRWGVAATLADLGTLAREQNELAAARSRYVESLNAFGELAHKRGVARLLECFACTSVAQSQPERALRQAGAAAALRKAMGAPLTPQEQAKLEANLRPARTTLGDAAGTKAWLQGWAAPIEKIVEEALRPDGELPAAETTTG